MYVLPLQKGVDTPALSAVYETSVSVDRCENPCFVSFPGDVETPDCVSSLSYAGCRTRTVRQNGPGSRWSTWRTPPSPLCLIQRNILTKKLASPCHYNTVAAHRPSHFFCLLLFFLLCVSSVPGTRFVSPSLLSAVECDRRATFVLHSSPNNLQRTKRTRRLPGLLQTPLKQTAPPTWGQINRTCRIG